MTHAIEESWHRRLAHFNYKALPYICKAVTSLPELKGDHEGVCNGCAQGKNIKNPFSKRDNKAEGVLELIQMCVAQCHHPPLVGMYTMYQKYQKYQKTRSTSPKIRRSSLRGVKVGFSKFRLHQHTRLSPVHLFLGSEFQNLKFEKLGFPHKTLSYSCSCSLKTSCCCSRRTSCNYP
jgi:hypothetical protein